MPETPEDRARKTIDDLLDKGGWLVQDRDKANVNAGRGVAVCSFPLKSGHGFADYLLYVDGQAAGVIEAKKEGETLIGFEIQTGKYSEGLPDGLKAYRRPLPFCYQSTGVETRFTNLLDPDARSRQVFAFHRPDTFAKWLEDEAKSPGSILRARLQRMPPLIEDGLRAIQVRAIRELEKSLAANRPRALIQMASGAGKTFTACNFSYRLIKHAGARRILFLVDRNTLGGQALGEFHDFVTPEEHRKFVELYNVQHMQSNKLDNVCKVCSIDNAAKRITAPKSLPSAEAPSRARQRLERGDVLVSMTQPNLNAVAMLPSSMNGACCWSASARSAKRMGRRRPVASGAEACVQARPGRKRGTCSDEPQVERHNESGARESQRPDRGAKHRVARNRFRTARVRIAMQALRSSPRCEWQRHPYPQVPEVPRRPSRTARKLSELDIGAGLLYIRTQDEPGD